MLLEILILISSGISVAPADSAAPNLVETVESRTPADVAPNTAPKDLGMALVESLAAICARHPEVERAFVVSQTAPDGSISYVFVPIFDRKVSNLVLNEAQTAYRTLEPSGAYLQIMLLARNSWKKQFGRVPPIYVRPRSVGKT